MTDDEDPSDDCQIKSWLIQIRRHFDRLVLHRRLIIQRLMNSFAIVKQLNVLKDFGACLVSCFVIAVVNNFVL